MFSLIIFNELVRLISMFRIVISQTGCKDTDFFQTCKSFSGFFSIFLPHLDNYHILPTFENSTRTYILYTGRHLLPA